MDEVDEVDEYGIHKSLVANVARLLREASEPWRKVGSKRGRLETLREIRERGNPVRMNPWMNHLHHLL